MKRFFQLIVLLAVAVVIAAFAFVQYLQSWADSPLPLQQATVLDVPAGSSFYRLSKQLEKDGWITDARMLRWYLRIKRNDHYLQAGEYNIAPGTTLAQLIKKLQSGDVIQYSVTLINGNTVKEFLASLAGNKDLKQTLAGKTPKQILAMLDSEHSHPEGLFYPDTYFFHKGETDFGILKRAYMRMQEQLQNAWNEKEENLPYASAYEALIMASIVEKETAVPSERALIAGVFVNRLRKKMRLQTDPTVIYGLGDQYKGNITRKHLKAYTPYNTYRINGLPPTPIANPALPAIEAALHPKKTNALYFVAKGDGSHHFSNTLEEHQKAVRQYQWKRRSDYRSTPQ